MLTTRSGTVFQLPGATSSRSSAAATTTNTLAVTDEFRMNSRLKQVQPATSSANLQNHPNRAGSPSSRAGLIARHHGTAQSGHAGTNGRLLESQDFGGDDAGEQGWLAGVPSRGGGDAGSGGNRALLRGGPRHERGGLDREGRQGARQ